MNDTAGQWTGPISAEDLGSIAERTAASQLVKVYALGIDRRDAAVTRSVFAADASVDGSFGPLGIDEYLAKIFDGLKPFGATQHHITNQHVTLQGDEAFVLSYAIAVHKALPDGGREDFTVGVEYHDSCRRTAKGWLIEYRKAVIKWNENSQGRRPQ